MKRRYQIFALAIIYPVIARGAAATAPTNGPKFLKVQRACLVHKPDTERPTLVERPAAKSDVVNFTRDEKGFPPEGETNLSPFAIGWQSVHGDQTPASVGRAGADCVIFSSRSGVVELRPSPAEWLGYLQMVRPNSTGGSGSHADFARDAEWNACLFLGALRSPNGNLRLVEVDRRVEPRGESRMTDVMHAWIIYTGDSQHPPDMRLKTAQPVNALPQPLSSNEQIFKFFEGRRDPADDSHFSIPYVRDGAAGIIDGWLTDDDAVVLVVRNGPCSRAAAKSMPEGDKQNEGPKTK